MNLHPRAELTAEHREQLERLSQMSDEDIDFSDIPEKRDWSRAVRGRFYRPQPLMVHWDASLERRLLELAKRDGTEPSELVQKFLLERTYQEEVRLGIRLERPLDPFQRGSSADETVWHGAWA